MTHYGLNPSFVYSSPLALFSNLLRRGRRFEVFTPAGVPTGEASPVGEDGLPREDGRLHGVKVWPGGVGPCPLEVPTGRPIEYLSGAVACVAHGWVGAPDQVKPHAPSVDALASLRPQVLRTLDWQRTNVRPDWTKPRVLPTDLLQGTDRGMAVELQAEAANLLGCHLWWCAPPRFELSVADYEVRMEEYLRAIKDTAQKPPILEYGNELWNAAFPVHGWLRGDWISAPLATTTRQENAAHEIAILKRVADRVFGPPGPLGAKPYYLFVGGQLTVPSHLDRILSALAQLGVTPDLAGPALYVTPMKAQREEWEATGAVPSQDELRASCFARLEEIAAPGRINDAGNFVGLGPLSEHYRVCIHHGVPYFACYEAGQSLIAGSHPWRRAALEAQRTEWMGELYREIRRVAESAGVDLLCWYSAATQQDPKDPRVAVFGLLESDEADVSKWLPKARAARGE